MTNPTTPFNWQMPTASDLVTDLPADFETFGQAVATSMADLLGGTTGQVLSKASNTDMDFTWTTANPGDITAVTAGTGITGGGTSGAVTVSFDQANFGGGQFAAGKNKIINGDFGIWQRGTSFALAGSGVNNYTADRFNAQFDGTGATCTVSQQTFTPGTAPVAGYEAAFFARWNRSAAGSGNTLNYYKQPIEDVRTFAGQTVTLSFWAKADASRTLTAQIYQEFGTGGSGAVNVLSGTASVTTSWQRFTISATIPSISGKTIGTNNSLTLYFIMPTGVAFTFDYWGVQLEAGSTATPFQTATGTIQGELAACQRYYYRVTPGSQAYGTLSGYGSTANSSTLFRNTFTYPVQLRTSATALDYSTLRFVDSGNATGSISNANLLGSENGVNVGLVEFTSSGLTQHRPILVQANNSTSAYIGFSAEL